MTYPDMMAEPAVPMPHSIADRAVTVTLTPTQTRVLHCVATGYSNKQIACELGIAEATVKVHMTALMRKLSAQNRTQVALAAHCFI